MGFAFKKQINMKKVLMPTYYKWNNQLLQK